MDDIIEKVLKRVESEISNEKKTKDSSARFEDIGVTEFIGTAMGPTIGLVVASIDPTLAKKMELGKYRSIGFISGRAGMGPQVMATDEAVKATNVEVLKVEGPRDDMGAAGAGSLIVVGGDDVADVRRCVEIALDNTEKYFGDVYTNKYGHLECQFTARASYCLNAAFGTPVGQAFGLVCGGPAAIGSVLSDIAIKAGNVEIVSFTSCTSGDGYSYANEVTTGFTGDSGAVHQAIKATISVGLKILGAMGDAPKSEATPYI